MLSFPAPLMSWRSRFSAAHSSAYRSGSSPYVLEMYVLSGVIQSISFVALSGTESIGICAISTRVCGQPAGRQCGVARQACGRASKKRRRLRWAGQQRRSDDLPAVGERRRRAEFLLADKTDESGGPSYRWAKPVQLGEVMLSLVLGARRREGELGSARRSGRTKQSDRRRLTRRRGRRVEAQVGGQRGARRGGVYSILYMAHSIEARHAETEADWRGSESEPVAPDGLFVLPPGIQGDVGSGYVPPAPRGGAPPARRERKGLASSSPGFRELAARANLCAPSFCASRRGWPA